MSRGYRMGLLLLGDSPSVPDGSTVTPINDVPTWLKCAGIPTTTYTTLTEVLADTSLLRMLINSENAMDYLVRCKNWIKQEALVPTMTSNTTPSGECIVNGVYSGYSGMQWKAFDKDESTYFAINKVVGNYAGYKFTTATAVTVVRLVTNSVAGETFTVRGSNDGSTWTDIDTITVSTGTEVKVLSSPVTYQYFNLALTDPGSLVTSGVFFNEIQFYNELGVTDNATAMQLIGTNDYASNTLLNDSTWLNAICNSAYFESVLNVKVPTMTGPTTPSGEAIGTYYETLYPWRAFNGITNSDSERWSGDSSFPQYVGYGFTSSCTVYAFIVMNRTQTTVCAIKDFVLQGSNDNNTWTDIQTYENLNNNASAVFMNVVASAQEFQYFRLKVTSINNGTRPIITELQFYGRQDGGVQSWLLAAGITNKNYTTVAQVLADRDLLPVLIASHSGMDYLATCIAFANEICANETAMQLIGNDNYASDALLSNATWLNAIANSTYFESVLNVKVPTMTSDTTPSGVCIGDATNGTYNWQTFDGNDSSRCFVLNQIGKVLGYQFTSECKVKKVFLKPYWSGDTYNVEGSNDGNIWNNIGSIVGNVSGSTAIVDATMNYTYYRMNQATKNTANIYQEIFTIQFYGREDV